MKTASTIALIVAALLFPLSMAWPQNPPGGFARLAAIAGEEALVQAVRDADLEQTALAKMEKQAAKEKEQTGDGAAAEALNASAVGHLEIARALYDYALARFERNATLINYKGELLYDQFGEQDAAVKLWNQALSLNDTLATAHNNLGIHYMHTGFYDMGLEHLDRAIALEKDNPDFCFNLAQMYLLYPQEIERRERWATAKVYREAMRYSKKAADLARGDYELLQDYAVNFFAATRFKVKADWKAAAKAWQAARASARNDDERFYTWLNEGRVWIQANKLEDARLCLDTALKLHPESDVAKNLLRGIEREIARN